MSSPVPRAAMVLAAGFGRRMAPLTDRTPKPLVPVAGRPLIDRVFDKLVAAGVERIVVNAHHLADQLVDHVSRRTDAEYVTVVEPEMLDTGGGLRNALDRLGDDPIFVCNSDSFWTDGPTPALVRLAGAWNAETMDALMLVHPFARAHGMEGSGDFFLDADSRVIARSEGRIAPFVYAAVQILKPELARPYPIEPFSIRSLWADAGSRDRLKAIVHDSDWFHVGTVDAIAETEAWLRLGSDAWTA